jgi:hypothetical protein
MTLILLVIVFALVFEYINGFHDTAISIATVVSTKVLTPGQAVFMRRRWIWWERWLERRSRKRWLRDWWSREL